MLASGKGKPQHFRIPGATRWMQGLVHKETAAPPWRSLSARPAIAGPYSTTPSCLICLRDAQATEHQPAILDLSFIAIKRARGRTGLHLALYGKDGTVTWAHKFLIAGVPMIGATQVSALRTEGCDCSFRRFRNP